MPANRETARRRPENVRRPSSDRELVEHICAGSERHFTELYERYFQRIYGFAYARLRNHADAEEVVQETFTAVFGSIDAFRGQSSLLSWIYGIARNTVNNHLRREHNQDLRHQRAAWELPRTSSFADATPEEQLHLRRYVEEIDRRLHSVTKWQIEVFLLRHVEDLPIQEIARRTAKSNDAVRSSLYRMKRLLVQANEVGLALSGA